MRLSVTALSQAGYTPQWFRPPYGRFRDTTVRAARQFGMETILWTIDTRDWTGVGAALIAQRVLQQVHVGGVILMHSNKSQTVQALPEIITTAREQGYRFVTLSEWQKVILAADCRADPKTCSASPSAITVTTPPILPEHPVIIPQEVKLSVTSETSVKRALLLPWARTETSMVY